MNYMVAPGVDHKVISPDIIENIVTRQFGVDSSMLRQRTRKITHVKPKQIAMYFLYEHALLTHQEAAGRYNLDHSTSVYARKVVQDMITVKDRDYYHHIELIRIILDKISPGNGSNKTKAN